VPRLAPIEVKGYGVDENIHKGEYPEIKISILCCVQCPEKEKI